MNALADSSLIAFASDIMEDTIRRAQAALPAEIGEPADWLIDGCRRKSISASTVVYDGQEIGFVGYHFDDRNSLVVNALVSFADFPAHSILAAAVEKIAASRNAPSIMGLTSRYGVASLMKRYGYRPVGIMLERIR